MKKTAIKFLAIALLLATVPFSCKKEPVQGISIDNALIKVGETVTLKLTFIPANAHNKKVNWESNNPSVATVDNKGKVTGISVDTGPERGTSYVNRGGTFYGTARYCRVSVRGTLPDYAQVGLRLVHP